MRLAAVQITKQSRYGKFKSEVKEVIQAYNAYYAFVIEVGGSFKSFSDIKETLKKNSPVL